MRNYLVLMLFVFSIKYGFSQNNIAGIYKSYFWESIKLNSDRTFFLKVVLIYLLVGLKGNGKFLMIPYI